MNAHDRETLRRIREAVEKGRPDDWFIAPGLSNKATLIALQAVEDEQAELNAALHDVDDLTTELARLRDQLKEEGIQLSDAHDLEIKLQAEIVSLMRLLEELQHDRATAIDERDHYLAKLNKLEAAMETMVPLTKVEAAEEQARIWESHYNHLHASFTKMLKELEDIRASIADNPPPPGQR